LCNPEGGWAPLADIETIDTELGEVVAGGEREWELVEGREGRPGGRGE